MPFCRALWHQILSLSWKSEVCGKQGTNETILTSMSGTQLTLNNLPSILANYLASVPSQGLPYLSVVPGKAGWHWLESDGCWLQRGSNQPQKGMGWGWTLSGWPRKARTSQANTWEPGKLQQVWSLKGKWAGQKERLQMTGRCVTAFVKDWQKDLSEAEL